MALYESLANLKAALKIVDTDRDTMLTARLTAASRAIDAHTGRNVDGFALAEAASVRLYMPRKRVVSDADGERLLVDEIGSTTDLVVEVGSGGVWTEVPDYETWPENALARGVPIDGLLLPYGVGWWATGATDRVRVTALWGWPAVPAVVAEATLLQAVRLYHRKDSPEGVLGSADWGPVRVARVDPDVQKLLTDLVLPGFSG